MGKRRNYPIFMKYYIIAGEASGDLHGANLMKALKRLDEQAVFRCWGGDRMQGAGGEMVKHYRDLAFMGFVEVVLNLRTILRNIRFCKKDIQDFQPDVLILIDYPGFNLRIAEFAKKKGFRVFYYISPQVWAWHRSRVNKMKPIIDRLFVILPFEQNFYKAYNWDVDFTGHPLLDALEEKAPAFAKLRPEDLQLPEDKQIVALLPGSRRQEIKRVLPVMLSVVPEFGHYQFVIAGAPGVPEEFYHQFTRSTDVPIVANQTYELLHLSAAALVTSGTATLETALMEVPQVVCYKGGWLSYYIARRLVQVDYISLVNLILGREVVKELIQGELTTENLVNELRKILPDGISHASFAINYRQLKAELGGKGASAKAAELMWQYLNESR